MPQRLQKPWAMIMLGATLRPQEELFLLKHFHSFCLICILTNSLEPVLVATV